MLHKNLNEVIKDLYASKINNEQTFDLINNEIIDAFSKYYEIALNRVVNLSEFNKAELLKQIHKKIVYYIKFKLEFDTDLHDKFVIMFRIPGNNPSLSADFYVFREDEYNDVLSTLSIRLQTILASYYVQLKNAEYNDGPAGATVTQMINNFTHRFNVYITRIKFNMRKLTETGRTKLIF